jgi:hypothetical protein
MRRKVLVALVVVAAIAIATWVVRGRRQQREAAVREQAYQVVLGDYSHALKPGMTRREVESYLHTTGKTFKQLCCVAKTSGSFTREGWDDLVKIGQEPVPFPCSENIVYVAFEFSPKTESELPQTNDSDTLKRVSVFHHLEGCM